MKKYFNVDPNKVSPNHLNLALNILEKRGLVLKNRKGWQIKK